MTKNRIKMLIAFSMFNITERAGLVELYGMLLITCSLANKSLVMSIKNKNKTKKMKDIKWNMC